MKISHLFTVALTDFRMAAEEEDWAHLVQPFLHRASDGNQYGQWSADKATFENTNDLFYWNHPPILRTALFAHMSMAQTMRSASNHTDEEFRSLAFDYQSWFEVTRHGGFQPFHNRPNSSWSGVLFVDLGDVLTEQPESGAILVHDSRRTDH